MDNLATHPHKSLPSLVYDVLSDERLSMFVCGKIKTCSLAMDFSTIIQ